MSVIFIVSKLFTFLVLPPGIFILIFFIMVFYAKKFKTVFIFFALGFYLLSNIYVANFLLRPLEQPYNKAFDSKIKADAVVVLGGGNASGSANLPLNADPSKRALYGLMIAKSQNIPLIFSGGALKGDESEASSFIKSMKEISKYLGVDMEFSPKLQMNRFVISTENRSIDTYQNAKFTKERFEEAGIQNPAIYLTTSAYHMKRAVQLYRHFGFKVIPCATDFKIGKRQKSIWDYFPKMGAFYKSYLALHEYAGLLSLKLRGI